ncbi:hypothetical protein SAMN04489859_1008125 [Paracoccus alcaliphilus]|uniref:Peptidase S74 domain-containing protein n=1 Tax=Paracoccus alcaliphilus TaxID=34002 RepID=A0A1H8H528_9RHOB|nr:tail fiber domain-containing protein [Paracoccus alcaliphilus]WCR17368.1 tail fiber domain-containing protein [Paracoccus alcaliphilus]SEN51346.1 hypothetical protein SAMN04489859_1008125 [Paracoccus alcaliphilus]
MKAPKAPDPYDTAQAQAGMNRDTAITQGQMNMIDTVNPWGSTIYDQTGENTFTDSQGNVVTTPKYTQTTNLSPSQQAIFDRTQAAEQNLAQIAQDQSGFLTDYLKGGIDLSGVPGLQSSYGPGYNPNFNGNLGLQTDAGLQTSVGPGYATSYAGADDFSADRQRYEDALWDRTAGDRSAQEAQMRTTLANKGIKEGSAAWNAEMERMQRQNTDARMATIMAGGQEQQRMVDMSRQAAMFGNDSILGRFGAENAAQLAGAQFGNDALAQQGMFGMGAQQAQNAAVAGQAGFNNAARQQGVAEQFAQRNQPLNEITALLSGSQVSNPAQMSAATPQTGVANTNIAGMIQQDYQNRLGASQGAMGGLFGLGGSLLGAAGNAGGFGALFSDERLKTDVQRVGTTDGGVPVYTYRYIWGGPVMMGVMAQDVPEAAIQDESGFLKVDYSRVN